MSQSISSEKVPESAEDITAEWLTKALDVEIKPETLKCTLDAHQPTGFLSNMVRIQFNDLKKPDGDTQLIAKLLPLEATPQHRELVIHEKMDLIEINLYKKIAPDLLEHVPELETFMCPFLYGNMKNGADDVENGGGSSGSSASVLLLKDLQFEGYGNKAFHQQTTLEEFYQGIEFLAKFHFAAMAVEYQKKKTLPEVYPWLPQWYKPTSENQGSSSTSTSSSSSNNKKRAILQEWFPPGLDNLNKILPEKNRYAFVDLKRSAYTMFNKVLEAGQEYPTLIHGDLWQNNVLYELKESKNRIKIIDWQMMGYADPMFDLAIYITSCFPEEQLSILSVELTVLKYVEEFNKLLEKKTESEGEGFKTSLKCRKDFHENLQFFNTYGLAYAFIWFTMSCDSIVSVPENLPKLVNVFRFLHDDMDLPAFLWSIV